MLQEKPRTRKELENILQTSDHEEKQIIIAQEAVLRNPELFKHHTNKTISEQLHTYLLNQKTDTIPITRENPVARGTLVFYTGQEKEGLEIIMRGLFLDQETRQKIIDSPAAEHAFTQGIKVLLEHTKGQYLKTKKTIPFAVHPLHATQLLSAIPDIPRAVLLATINHDTLEDTIFGGKDNTLKERVEQLRRLQEGKDKRVNEDILLAGAMDVAATRQEMFDYLSSLEDMSSPSKFLLECGLTNRPELIKQAMYGVHVLKAGGDKMSAGTTLTGFDTEETLKHYAKAFAVIMACENYVPQCTPEQQLVLTQATKNLAVITYEHASECIKQLQYVMGRGFGTKRRAYQQFFLKQNIEKLNKKIVENYLEEFTPNGTLHTLLSLGYTKLKTGHVSRLVKSPEEDEEEAIRRLQGMREEFLTTIPSIVLSDHEARSEEILYLRSLTGKERDNTIRKYQNLYDVYLRVGMASSAAAVIPNHQFRVREE